MFSPRVLVAKVDLIRRGKSRPSLEEVDTLIGELVQVRNGLPNVEEFIDLLLEYRYVVQLETQVMS